MTDSEIIDAIRGADTPVVSRQMVAESVGISKERARVRLKKICKAGPVEKAKLNENAVVYWIED